MITLKDHLLLRFLNVNVVVNGTEIYPLSRNRKVVIEVEKNNPVLVVTDGFHITKPLELVYHHIHTYYFKVVCDISDYQLGAGIFLMIVCGLLGFISGLLALKLISFFPILYFLFLFYIRREEFIQLRPT